MCADTNKVIDFETRRYSEEHHVYYVKAFCNCGWEKEVLGAYSAWAEGEIHLRRHLTKGEPSTYMMADGPVTFQNVEEYEARRQNEVFDGR